MVNKINGFRFKLKPSICAFRKGVDSGRSSLQVYTIIPLNWLLMNSMNIFIHNTQQSFGLQIRKTTVAFC